MKLTDRITVRLPLYAVTLIVVALAVIGLGWMMTRKGAEISGADYRRYEDVSSDNDFLKGPIAAALSDDGVITTDEVADLDEKIKIMAQGSYQVTGDARVELERRISDTPPPPR